MDPGLTPSTVRSTIAFTPGLSLSQTPSDHPIVRSPSDPAIAETQGFRKPCGARKKCGVSELRPFDGPLAEYDVTPDVARQLEVQLPMEVSVIAHLMPFVNRAMNELRPPLGVAAENEERRVHAVLRKRIENRRSGVGIRTVVERERDLPLFGREMSDHGPEDEAVPVERAVYGTTQHGKSECSGQNHAVTAGPRTAE